MIWSCNSCDVVVKAEADLHPVTGYCPECHLSSMAPELLAKLKEIHEYEHGEDGACECATFKLIEKAEGRSK